MRSQPSAGLGERAITSRRTDQRRVDCSAEERWRSPSAGHTHGTAWLIDSTTELRKSSQRDKLEEFLTHIQVSGDPTDENGQLDRVLYIGALVKSEGEGNEGRDVGLQRVVNVVRHLLDATMNGTGRKAHALKDRTLLKTSWGFAGRIAMLLPSRVAGRTPGLRGPDLARGPDVARP